ncbi:acyl-CoA dehydrogenase family protein [Actinoplanes sp. NPDC051475]|uniref:acyl-CoA dehydrogenase family protein n=1 Tax=Actinoplanes sp. NPDC051475 TaxID=3157225 RepID=UPI00344FA72F
MGLAVFLRGLWRLVTATAPGTAAGVHALVVDGLAARTRVGSLPRVRDNALITLGPTHAQITAALLAAVTTARLAAAADPGADLAARVGKAAGVDSAVQTVAELAPLLGAAGFQRHHPIAKARADLNGLLYPDGIHDSLYRSGGLSLLTAASAPSRQQPAAPVLAPAVHVQHRHARAATSTPPPPRQRCARRCSGCTPGSSGCAG